jgi:heme exporter protein B
MFCYHDDLCGKYWRHTGDRCVRKKSSMLDLLMLVIRRDLILAMRRRADVLTTLVFFVMVVSLFPLGVGPELGMLRKMAPGVLWVAALLASMLSLGRLFSADYLDGTLEQMMLAPQSLSMLVLGKMVAHWMVSGLPLVLMAPVLGLQFDMSVQALGVLIIGLLLGTPILSMMGAIGAALTLGLRGGGVLLSLLVLPLCIPVLIFGAGAVDAVSSGLSIASHLSLLGALLVLALVFTPWVTAQALRISME